MKKWTIILENEFMGNHKPKTICINALGLKRAIIIISVMLIFSLSVFVTARIFHLDPNAKYALNARKYKLINDIDDMNSYIDNMIGEMESFVMMEKSLRILANLEPLPEDVRKLGVGGYTVTDERVNRFDAGTKKIVNNLDNRLFQVQNIIRFEKENLDDISINMNEHYNLLKHKPSIMPTNGWITSKFGERKDPFSKKKEFHPGLDIANDYNTPIYSPADGIVIFNGVLSGYGNVLKIDHGYGYVTVYAHLKKTLVKKGSKVQRHQLIAQMGSTGKSTGPHLHYEVRLFNKKTDPMKFIDKDNTVR